MNLAPVKYELVSLSGGLDLVTPTLSLKPGMLRDARNFEVNITGGYTRIAGYERVDGRPAPSAALLTGLVLDGTGSPSSVSAGSVITSGAASATVVAVAADGLTLALTKQTGSFTIGGTVLVGATNVGKTATNYATFSSADTATYQNLAADVYRADIQAVPGSGPVRGVVYYKGTVYAWRDNAGGTALDLYKTSSSGWTAVALGYEVSFNTGTAAIAEGNTVTGGTSGATGVVTRVVVETGTWGAGTAAGRLILSSKTGTFTAAENLTVSAAVKAKAGGAASAITLAPGGRVITKIDNFGGQSSNTRIYGVDGKNRAFEFDGTVYVPISSGMSPDTPARIAVHSNHLFLTFGASIQFSGINAPYVFTPITGAGEFVLSDDVTDTAKAPGAQTGDALVFFTQNSVSVLYGTSSADWKLTEFSNAFGATSHSAQRLEGLYAFDPRGVFNLQMSQNYGNFDAATLTYGIRPYLQTRRTLVTASGVNREKSQYRLFFSDGYGLYVTIVNGKYAGAMPVVFPDVVRCWAEGPDIDGVESAYFGTDDGMVHKLDAGTSFDGDPINAYLEFTWDAVNSPRLRKRFRRASIEVASNSYATFFMGYRLGYGSAELEQGVIANASLDLTSVYWDRFVWDTFIWDAVTLSPAEMEVTGTGENIAIRISSEDEHVQPFTVNSFIIHYSLRRGIR